MLNIREMDNAKVVNRKKPDHISVFFNGYFKQASPNCATLPQETF